MASKPLSKRLADTWIVNLCFSVITLVRPLPYSKYFTEGHFSFNPRIRPSRSRQRTRNHEQAPDGFDAQFPIRHDRPCIGITAGNRNCNDLLQLLKSQLPYILRYQISHRNRWREGHPDYNSVTIRVPRAGMPAHELLRLIAQHLPGWQATRFPSQLILYKEHKQYTHGTTIWPE